MLLVRVLLSVMFFAIRLSLFAQTNDSLINWNSKLLTWKDFKGKPPINRNLEKDTVRKIAAITSSSIYCLYSYKNDTINYLCYAYFQKNSSWTVTNLQYDLLHEQEHFNITELVARRAKKFLYSKNTRSYILNKTFSRVADSIVNSVYVVQAQYDNETDFGTDTIAQYKWNAYIKLSLDSLDKYKSAKGKIIIGPVK